MAAVGKARADKRSFKGSARDGVPVTVTLFGMLSVLARQRSVQFHLPRGSTLADVIDELGRRFGGDFLGRILRVPGEFQSYCSLFVNGEQVEDLGMEIKPSGATAQIGVILFMASEGG